MLAIDTNLVVRYLTGDHPQQSAKAKTLVNREEVYVCTTVILETEWVLRSAYGFEAKRVCKALRGFGGLPNVVLEDPGLVSFALDRMDEGMDFADALHLGRAASCEAFLTFDQRFVRSAKAIGLDKVRLP
ncbi:type II toxin-antitoxin system VapC family toxin [Bradyrhizobium guangzhouense]|uniref:type II toxin-antitoxin system VapC family toxin n=1 Tax=Bradyrhizobium guangzhouense TaxID=1325095 RepID=UPI001009898E|nr:type II toxin-antitoxin system VapC family toxin [Bradyrhizobium guangzhouense]RXH12546.1 type II toxin-antitoxin system VapC family toxin [Bradyrhizobium guangzhouense]